jgi:hypothetical protein
MPSKRLRPLQSTSKESQKARKEPLAAVFPASSTYEVTHVQPPFRLPFSNGNKPKYTTVTEIGRYASSSRDCGAQSLPALSGFSVHVPGYQRQHPRLCNAKHEMQSTTTAVPCRRYTGEHHSSYIYQKTTLPIAPGRRGHASLLGVTAEWGIDSGKMLCRLVSLVELIAVTNHPCGCRS